MKKKFMTFPEYDFHDEYEMKQVAGGGLVCADIKDLPPDLFVEKGSVIGPMCYLQGNTIIIRNNSTLIDTQIRTDKSLSKGVTISQSVIQNSWILYGHFISIDNCNIKVDLYSIDLTLNNTDIYFHDRDTIEFYDFDDPLIISDIKITYQPYMIRRSDGYNFYLFRDKKDKIIIQAGCRRFTLKEAKEHWNDDHRSGKESQLIVNSLVKLDQLIRKKEG